MAELRIGRIIGYPPFMVSPDCLVEVRVQEVCRQVRTAMVKA